MTLTERFESIFRLGGIAFKECKAFGTHGLFTFYSRNMANRAARALKAASFTVRGPVETIDYAKENKGSCLNRTTVRVWLVGCRA